MTSTQVQPGAPSCNTGKMMTRRVQAHDRTTVILSFTPSDANALRVLAQSITLKAGKKPSLSLISRRALEVYSDLLRSPETATRETDELNRMVTPVPSPASRSKRKVAKPAAPPHF